MVVEGWNIMKWSAIVHSNMCIIWILYAFFVVSNGVDHERNAFLPIHLLIIGGGVGLLAIFLVWFFGVGIFLFIGLIVKVPVTEIASTPITTSSVAPEIKTQYDSKQTELSAKFCTKCGTKLKDNARFCHVCSEPVKAATMVMEQKSSVVSAIKTQNDSNRTQPERNKWFSKINIIIYVFIFIIICSFLVYQFILKPNPVRDAKKAASAYCNCEQNRYNETNKTLVNFVNTFETYNFKDFEEANNKYIEIQESINSASNNKINAIYDDLRNKYLEDNEKLNLFDLTYNAYKRKCDTINSDFIAKQSYYSILGRKMNSIGKKKDNVELKQTPSKTVTVSNINNNSNTNEYSITGECISGDCQNGIGTANITADSKYTGEWKNGLKDGQGTLTMISSNGDKLEYEGQFKDDKMDGKGTLVASNGKYIGEWKDGKRNGQGTMLSSNGDKYIGEWKDDNMNGQGTATWANGSMYSGEWKDNSVTGYGTFTDINGVKSTGLFENGKLVKSN